MRSLKYQIAPFLFFMLLLASCGNTQDKIQRGIFGANFSYADVKAIEIEKIDSKQGIKTHVLDAQQRQAFIGKLNMLEYDDAWICKTKYIIRLIVEKDTFHLEACENRILAQSRNACYRLKEGGDFSDFIKE